jgi:dTDP-4-dehydrorhamnose reductase
VNAPIVVLGAGGMLGHKVFQALQARFPTTVATLRGGRTDPPLDNVSLFRSGAILEHIDVQNWAFLTSTLSTLRPTVIVNCVGVIKQRADTHAAIPSITINSLLPHWLATAAESWGGRVIHFSSDCVFSGRDGGYIEDSVSDAEDLYGRTKYLGEVAYPNSLTLRTSIIGRELSQHKSLLDWFLARNHGTVNGFTRHYYTGVTTNYLAELVADLIVQHPSLFGVYQVASDRISKYELLQLLREAYDLDVTVLPDDGPFCDRSLRGDRFVRATGHRPPPWPELVQQLASDPTPYIDWLGDRAPGGR